MGLIRGSIVAFAAAMLAGCGGLGSKQQPQAAAIVDPNPYPTNYRKQIVTLLTTALADRTAFRGALITQPELRQVPQSQMQHYVVCLQLNGRSEHKEKIVEFLDGVPNLFIDAPQGLCSGAAYQPFPELEAALPSR